MITPKLATNVLSKYSTVCKLKRGPKNVYVFDLMGLLYSMCGISAIADLLVQEPAVPTRTQVTAYLDKWNEVHKFGAIKKKRKNKRTGRKAVHIIFVCDGRKDKFKIAR